MAKPVGGQISVTLLCVTAKVKPTFAKITYKQAKIAMNSRVRSFDKLNLKTLIKIRRNYKSFLKKQ